MKLTNNLQTHQMIELKTKPVSPERQQKLIIDICSNFNAKTATKNELKKLVEKFNDSQGLAQRKNSSSLFTTPLTTSQFYTLVSLHAKFNNGEPAKKLPELQDFAMKTLGLKLDLVSAEAPSKEYEQHLFEITKSNSIIDYGKQAQSDYQQNYDLIAIRNTWSGEITLIRQAFKNEPVINVVYKAAQDTKPSSRKLSVDDICNHDIPSENTAALFYHLFIAEQPVFSRKEADQVLAKHVINLLNRGKIDDASLAQMFNQVFRDPQGIFKNQYLPNVQDICKALLNLISSGRLAYTSFKSSNNKFDNLLLYWHVFHPDPPFPLKADIMAKLRLAVITGLTRVNQKPAPGDAPSLTLPDMEQSKLIINDIIYSQQRHLSENYLLRTTSLTFILAIESHDYLDHEIKGLLYEFMKHHTKVDSSSNLYLDHEIKGLLSEFMKHHTKVDSSSNLALKNH